jgi:hypothetical protein
MVMLMKQGVFVGSPLADAPALEHGRHRGLPLRDPQLFPA